MPQLCDSTFPAAIDRLPRCIMQDKQLKMVSDLRKQFRSKPADQIKELEALIAGKHGDDWRSLGFLILLSRIEVGEIGARS